MNNQSTPENPCVTGEHFSVHQFADRACPSCGTVFCHNCCGGSNRDQGGKHEPDWTACPACGHNCDQNEA
jgi:hypothetical protein